MRQQLSDYGLKLDHIPICCDNTSAINLSKNPILHSRTKHIEIRHHFLQDHVQKEDCASVHYTHRPLEFKGLADTYYPNVGTTILSRQAFGLWLQDTI